MASVIPQTRSLASSSNVTDSRNHGIANNSPDHTALSRGQKYTSSTRVTSFSSNNLGLAVGAVMMGVGAFLTMTGMGACAGVPLLAAGGALMILSGNKEESREVRYHPLPENGSYRDPWDELGDESLSAAERTESMQSGSRDDSRKISKKMAKPNKGLNTVDKENDEQKSTTKQQTGHVNSNASVALKNNESVDKDEENKPVSNVEEKSAKKKNHSSGLTSVTDFVGNALGGTLNIILAFN